MKIAHLSPSLSTSLPLSLSPSLSLSLSLSPSLSTSLPPSLSLSLPLSLSLSLSLSTLHKQFNYLQYSVSFVVVRRCVRNANLCFKTRPMECRDQWRFRGQCVTVDYLYDIITLVCLHKYMKYNALNKLLNFTYIHKYTIKFHCTHYYTVLLLYYTIYIL